MQVKVGDRISVESEKVGRPVRHGVVLEVIEADYGTHYRVAWDDGHETVFKPTAGSVTLESPEQAPSPKA